MPVEVLTPAIVHFIRTMTEHPAKLHELVGRTVYDDTGREHIVAGISWTVIKGKWRCLLRLDVTTDPFVTVIDHDTGKQARFRLHYRGISASQFNSDGWKLVPRHTAMGFIRRPEGA